MSGPTFWTVKDLARTVSHSDSAPATCKLATVEKIVGIALLQIGLYALVDGVVQIDLGNGHVLTGVVEEKPL